MKIEFNHSVIQSFNLSLPPSLPPSPPSLPLPLSPSLSLSLCQHCSSRL